MKTIVCALLIAITGSAHASAGDGFEKVTCGQDVVEALVGQRGANEPVVKTEARHKNLGLTDLGASDYGAFSSISWLICGQDYMVLEDNRTNLVRDAIQIPPHSKDSPWFEGSCKRKGSLAEASFVGILRNEDGQDQLPADAAWMVDEKAVRFVKVSTDDLLCGRDGILERP